MELENKPSETGTTENCNKIADKSDQNKDQKKISTVKENKEQ